MNNEHSKINEYIGARIRHYRGLNDVSIEQLANSLNFNAEYLSRVENGKEELSLEEIVAIANNLKIPSDCLMADLIECRSETSCFIEKLLEVYMRIPVSKRREFLILFDKMMQLLDTDDPE